MKKFTNKKEIESWYLDNSYDLFDCGQGYYQDEAVEYCLIDKQYYEVTIFAIIEHKWMDRGDKLAYVESIDKVECKLIDVEVLIAREVSSYSNQLLEIEKNLQEVKLTHEKTRENIRNYV
ncbi:MAG: hypothetical protein QM489_01215 [Candidatus Izemoplasma sp.]